jgi:DNA-binding PadR family transcriptional regulator
MKPSYYSIIPADVRYNKNIPAAAKLLYAEITSLLNMNAYCYAKNEYFAELYEVSISCIQKWLSALQKENLIEITITRDEKGTNRIIKLPTMEGVEKVTSPACKNLHGGIEKFTPAYNEININNNIKKRDINISKKEKRKKEEMPAEILHCIKPEIWQEWIDYRIEKKQSLTSATIKRQFEFLNKQYEDFREDPNEIILQSITNGWTGLFPLRKEKSNRPTSQQKQNATNSIIDSIFKNNSDNTNNEIIDIEVAI